MHHDIIRAVTIARPMSLRTLALDGADVAPGLRDAEGPVFEAVVDVLREKADAATPEDLACLTKSVWGAFSSAMSAENGPLPSETCACWEDCNCEQMDDVLVDCGSGWFDAVLDVLRAAAFTPLERLEAQAREGARDEAEARAWDALHWEAA